MDHGMDHSTTAATAHMTFFWGKDAEILFSGWPGTRGAGMYALALVVVFALAVAVEWLSSFRRKEGGAVAQTAVHGLRMGLGYVVMLAVMSFNVGVLVVAVVGHCLGFFLFGGGVLKKMAADSDKGLRDSAAGC